MPINTTNMGPGTLSLGSGPLQVAAQVVSCKVTPSETVDAEDDLMVLSGETLDGEETATYDFVLEGQFLQDLAVSGVVDWSWTNMGTEQPFTYVPNTTADKQVDGTLVPVPLSVGGDEAGKRMTSDFTWRIVGTPAFEAVP